jgi:tetratricopeptide (TPR) repeat protein
MLIATYREVELDETLPFNQVLMDLNRERLAVRIKLSRFSRQETETMLAALFAEEITPVFLDGIYRETEGNPFFIEEVCKSLVENRQIYYEDGAWQRPENMADMAIPQSVRIAIQSRVSKFPDEYRETFNLAAILGREFDFDTLLEASDLDEDTLIDALETGEQAQLIEEVSGKGGATFSFAHALIPTTLAEGVRTLRRKRLHQRAAQAIEALRPGDFEALAHHYYESGDVDGGLKYSLKAGERALELSDHIQARRHYERAFEIAELVGRSDELIVIHLALGDIDSVADFYRALKSYDQALALTQDPIQQAIIKGKIGKLHVVMGNELGLPLLQEAVNTLNPETHGNELAQAIASIGRYYHNRGQHRLAMEQLETARQIADPLEDVPTLIYVYTFLAGANQHLANFERSNEWARWEIELGSEAKYPFMEAVGYEYLAENQVFMGRWEEALKYAQRDQELGENNGLPERVRWAKMIRLWALQNMGQVELAIQEGLFSLDQAEASGDWRLAALAGAELARAYGNTNDFDTARRLAEAAVERALDLDQAYMICVAQDALAYLHGLHGEWQQALESREVTVEAAEGSDNGLIPMINSPGLAEALLETGRADKATRRLDEGLAIARESNSPFPEARALRVLGRIHAHREEAESASKIFADAVKICEEWGSQLLMGRILLDWASLQAAQDSRQTAASTLKRSLDIFETAGAKYWVERTWASLVELSGEADFPEP